MQEQPQQSLRDMIAEVLGRLGSFAGGAGEQLVNQEQQAFSHPLLASSYDERPFNIMDAIPDIGGAVTSGLERAGVPGHNDLGFELGPLQLGPREGLGFAAGMLSPGGKGKQLAAGESKVARALPRMNEIGEARSALAETMPQRAPGAAALEPQVPPATPIKDTPLEAQKRKLSAAEYEAGVQNTGDGMESFAPPTDRAPAMDKINAGRAVVGEPRRGSAPATGNEAKLYDQQVAQRAGAIQAEDPALVKNAVHDRLFNMVFGSNNIGGRTYPPLFKRITEPGYRFLTQPPKDLIGKPGWEKTPAGQEFLLGEAEATLLKGKAYDGSSDQFRSATTGAKASSIANKEHIDNPEHGRYSSKAARPDDFNSQEGMAPDTGSVTPGGDNVDELAAMGIHEPSGDAFRGDRTRTIDQRSRDPMAESRGKLDFADERDAKAYYDALRRSRENQGLLDSLRNDTGGLMPNEGERAAKLADLKQQVADDQEFLNYVREVTPRMMDTDPGLVDNSSLNRTSAPEPGIVQEPGKNARPEQRSASSASRSGTSAQDNAILADMNRNGGKSLAPDQRARGEQLSEPAGGAQRRNVPQSERDRKASASTQTLLPPELQGLLDQVRKALIGSHFGEDMHSAAPRRPFAAYMDQRNAGR